MQGASKSEPPSALANVSGGVSTGTPETQDMPPVVGPKYPESEVAALPPSASKSESEWRKMLEPYLVNKSPTGNAATPSSPEMPPLLPLAGETVRVGLLLPLSGKNAALGHAMLNAAQIALFDFADTDFELLPHDTMSLPDEASFGATMVIGDGASLLVGPLLSSSVQAVAPLSRAAGIPVIAFSSDSAAAGSGVYTMGFLPENDVERVVSYALSQGLTRFAALAPSDAYGRAVVSATRAAVTRAGASMIDIAFYDPSGDNIEPVIRSLADYDTRRAALVEMRKTLNGKEDELSIKTLQRLKVLETLGDLPYEALLIADGGDRLQRVAALLPFFDIDPKKIRVLGTGRWDVPGIGTEPALIGGWFAAPPPQAREAFAQRYKDLYGAHPPRLATLAYDAVALAAVLARGGSANPFAPSAVMLPSGYAGRDGIFRFNAAGTAERGLAVLQVEQRNNVVIDTAPSAFTELTN